ncbi:DMP19 family protein [Notoacmeibacter ruber]|uniref:DNA mimic protein DMP19 C-terminal domain-containing protein n=1 Tax=Notoacmeibacter ruber TaxID=2670375 RepID=A0A3L7JEY7_9HYPH|nr:hypothetical protein [Notoacmeibacter ruber]RLQ88141.1 hypothetical protein D8780_07950 [Notoacmeibacter ruber]
MLSGLLKKKKKTEEPEKAQLSRDEVGSRLKGIFKDSTSEPALADEKDTALKRRAASAAAAALDEGEVQDTDESDDLARVEKADAEVQAIAAPVKRARPRRADSGPNFRDIGRDIQAHLATLRNANADIQDFLSAHPLSPLKETNAVSEESSDEGDQRPEASAEAAVAEETLPMTEAVDQPMPTAEGSALSSEAEQGKVEEETASISEAASIAETDDVSEGGLIESPHETRSGVDADDIVAGETDEEPAADAEPHRMIEAPSMAPDVSDIADENAAEPSYEDAGSVTEEKPKAAYKDPGHMGDQIASMTPEEHHERLRRLEEMVTLGFDNNDDDGLASEDDDASQSATPDETTARDQMEAISGDMEPGHPDDNDAPAAEMDEEGSHIAIPLMLSDEVMEQDDDTAAHELNAQICDFLLFDALAMPEELSKQAFMGWSVDFLWRNTTEGGLARFAHHATDREEIWYAVIAGLEAVEAENHLRVVEALQALLAQDAELSEALASDPEAGAGVEVLQELDEAFAEAEEEMSLPHAIGGWLKSQDNLEVLDTESLRSKVSSYAELPELRSRGEGE